MTESEFNLPEFVPGWLKGVFVSVLSFFQFGAGIAYASVPATASNPSGIRVDAITVVALASPFVTLAIGAMTIASRHRITARQMELESRHGDREQGIKAHQMELDFRLKVLERGIKCNLDGCPIVMATSKESLQVADEEKTVDLP